jgi:hypothetical protein
MLRNFRSFLCVVSFSNNLFVGQIDSIYYCESVNIFPGECADSLFMVPKRAANPDRWGDQDLRRVVSPAEFWSCRSYVLYIVTQLPHDWSVLKANWRSSPLSHCMPSPFLSRFAPFFTIRHLTLAGRWSSHGSAQSRTLSCSSFSRAGPGPGIFGGSRTGWWTIALAIPPGPASTSTSGKPWLLVSFSPWLRRGWCLFHAPMTHPIVGARLGQARQGRCDDELIWLSDWVIEWLSDWLALRSTLQAPEDVLRTPYSACVGSPISSPCRFAVCFRGFIVSTNGGGWVSRGD